jgi:hypothetical protein
MGDAMTSSKNPHPAREIEQLLASLYGVRSATVVLAPHGQIEEIHILCSPALMPKQVVRNIESALSAGLGIHIDRRIVSVAQLRDDVESGGQRVRAQNTRTSAPHDPPASRVGHGNAGQTSAGDHARTASPAPRAEAPAPSNPARTRTRATQSADAGSGAASSPSSARAPADHERRFVFVGFDATTRAGLTTCRVAVRRGRKESEGTGEGPNTPRGRASAAADALFRAVAQFEDGGVGLDGAVIVDLSGKHFVLVSAQADFGRQPVQLTGVAALTRSPEEAAILAALQAANRWAEPR